MSRTKLVLGSTLLGALGALLVVGCTDSADSTVTTRSAISGETCTQNATYLTRSDSSHGGGHSPTGIPGDNMDDLHSGKIDCLGDGNSGQGDDKRHPCTPDSFPQPGCDDQGCCDDDVIDPADDPADDPAADPTTPPDDGCGGDPGTDQPPADPTDSGGPTDPVL